LLESHRIVRGSLVSKVKDSMLKVFREKLPPINSKPDAADIRHWKSHPGVKECFTKLFKKIDPLETDTYMTKILDLTWKDKKQTPKNQIAFAISICQVILNPNNLFITISEEAVKLTLLKNIVSF